jgi:hypothetical protein
MPLATEMTVQDDLGLVHPVAKAVKAVKGLPLLPGKAAVAPGQDLDGYVVFAVPEGRALRSVSLAMEGSGDPVTWQVAP